MFALLLMVYGYGSDDHSLLAYGKAVVECELKGHKRFVRSVDFSPEGSHCLKRG